MCRQVIERHLLNPLPQIFCPEEVAVIGDDKLQDISAESSENVMSRNKLKEIRENLQCSLSDLRQ